jgi:hypothetical protein
MPKPETVDKTFAALKKILEAYARRMIVLVDKPGDYQLGSPTMKDRIGRPLFVAAVQTKKNYVSFHLMPVYACPDLLQEISPALRKRMQGKSCFNFTAIDPAQVHELTELTKNGIEQFKNIKLPWV